MQCDEHIWAWRTHRRYMRGFTVGLGDIGVLHFSPDLLAQKSDSELRWGINAVVKRWLADPEVKAAVQR
jgi:hypothetical protein